VFASLPPLYVAQRQLLRLTLSYCPHSGSSVGLRTLLSTDLLPFASTNPDLEISVSTRPGKHPYVKGEYRTGWDKVIGVKNEVPEVILKKMNLLNDSSGRKNTKFTEPVVGEVKSHQGR